MTRPAAAFAASALLTTLSCGGHAKPTSAGPAPTADASAGMTASAATPSVEGPPAGPSVGWDVFERAQPLAVHGDLTFWGLKRGAREGLGISRVVDGSLALLAVHWLDLDAVIVNPSKPGVFAALRRGEDAVFRLFASPTATPVELSKGGLVAAFSPDGATFVSVGPEATRVLDGSTGSLLWEAAGCKVMNSAVFTPAGDFVLADPYVSYEGPLGVMILDLEARRVDLCDDATNGAVRADGRFVATIGGSVGDDGSPKLVVQVMDRDKGTTRALPFPFDVLRQPGISFDRTGDVIVSAKQPNAMGQRYEPELVARIDPSKNAAPRFAGPNTPIQGLGLDARAEWLELAGTFAGAVVQKKPRALVPTMLSLYYNHLSYAVTEDGKTAVLTSGVLEPSGFLASDLELLVVDVASKKLTRRIPLPTPELTSIRLQAGPGDHIVASTYDFGSARLVNLSTGAVTDLPTNADASTLSFERGGQLLIVGARLYDLKTHAELSLPVGDFATLDAFIRGEGRDAPLGAFCRLGPKVLPPSACLERPPTHATDAVTAAQGPP